MLKGQSQTIVKTSESTLLKIDKTNENVCKAVKVGNDHLMNVMAKKEDN